MKTIKTWLATIAVLLCSISASAHDFVVNGIYYNILSAEDKTVEVTYANSFGSAVYTGSVIIPNSVTYNGVTFSVTSIASSAFRDCSSLTNVIIPNSVTTIEGAAFWGCTKLTSITIPNSVTSMENAVLGNCSSLTSVSIPNSVTSIGDQFLDGCVSLTSVSIPNSVTSIGDYAFCGCQNLTDITIPNSVTSIGSDAFSGTSWYENQPNGVVYVNDVLYKYKEDYDAPNNTIVEIREGTINISPKAFLNCTKLTGISIPNSVTSIGESAFRGCTGLTNIYIPNSVTSIGESAFEACLNLSDVSIANSVTSIESRAFYDCWALTSISIPNSVTSIGNDAFSETPWYENQPNGVVYVNDVLYKYKEDYDAPNNTIVEIREGTISISPEAFYNCNGLTSISIPNTVTSIGDRAFSYCDNLTDITLPNSVTSIGKSAFFGCSALTSIYIPNSVTSIESEAFHDCIALTSISIPNSVTSIGNSAFTYCLNLTDITIPNSVISIGEYAFSNCKNLKDITIPNSVTSIEGHVFDHCLNLTSINIPNTVTSIGNSAFTYCSNLTDITLPNSITSIGNSAFFGCSALTSISIPESVIKIGTIPFGACNNLSNITSLSLTPPIAIGHICDPSSAAYNSKTLFIPSGAKSAYSTALYWRNFTNIEELKASCDLVDGEEYNMPSDKSVNTLTYTRTLPNLQWNALFVPFEIPVSDLADDYDVAYINDIHSYDKDLNGEIDQMEMEVIYIKEGTLHANHPYLIRAKGDDAKAMSIVVTDATLYSSAKADRTSITCSSAYTDFEVIGTYEKMTAQELDGCYAINTSGVWSPIASGASLNPFRLYMTITSRNGSPVKVSQSAMSRINIRVQSEDTETGIGEIVNEDAKAEIYDMTGRRLQNAHKGIYIINGKKVIK